MPVVDILILGAGWLSSFLIPLCKERRVSYAATTRDGRNGTLRFKFDPSSDDTKPFRTLPDAQTVLITFPITQVGGSTKLATLYAKTHHGRSPRFIQLGVTDIWKSSDGNFMWFDRHSPYIPNPRAVAEQELLDFAPSTVLDLAGLWGGTRSMRNWVGKVVGTKEELRKKGSIHMIHGLDVSRAILAVHSNFGKATGQRWILTDGRVYDWWDLASSWGPNSKPPAREQHVPAKSVDKDDLDPQARWVRELMRENNVRALPRNVELLGRALDSREFWETFELSPVRARLD